MPITHKNIKNIFIYIVPNFISLFLSLITISIMTRLLTPRDYGIVFLARMFPAIAVGILTFGLTGATQRNYFAYYRDQIKTNALIISTQILLYASLILSLLVVSFFRNQIAALTLGHSKYGNAILVCFLSVFFAYIINFYLIIYQSMEKAKQYAFYVVLQAFLVSSLSVFYVWYFKLSYMGPLLASLTATSVVLIILFIKFNVNYIYKLNFALLIENVKYGLQLMPKTLTVFINNYFDKYMLVNMISLSAVGIYNLGQNACTILMQYANAVWNAFQPAFYREIFEKGDKASGLIGRLFTVFSYLALFPVLLVVLFAREIIYVLAPPAYYQAIPIVIIFACSFSAHIFGMFIGLQHAYTKTAYMLFPKMIFGTIVNVIANIILIPRFGLIGGAVAALLSAFCLNGVSILVGQKVYRVIYQWRFLTLIYLNILIPSILLIYFQRASYPIYFSYAFKIIALVTYLYIGYRRNLLTKDKLSWFLRSKSSVATQTFDLTNSAGRTNL